jgi:hypothetical protein
VTVGTHFCGGEAVESKVILGEANLGCDISDMEKHCGYSENAEKNGNSVEEHPCCNNEYQTVQVTNQFVKNETQKTFNIEFALAFIYTTLNINLFPKFNHQINTIYTSPTIEKDIQVLFQTFLN